MIICCCADAKQFVPYKGESPNCVKIVSKLSMWLNKMREMRGEVGKKTHKKRDE